ncbi:MAG: flagellar biosynthesis anti-sigma factor FlgM [Bdellovibrionales bacterium]|nr:flagellar biosynthesis anti-sigma factor FlgM [Bdellovibrionales bacterium]
MDISKLKSDQATDRVQEGRVRGNSATSKTGRTQKTGESRDALATERAAPSGPDQVKLSSDAHGLKEGVEIARNASDVRGDKVAALKAQIKNGTYKVDDKAVAEKMLQSSIEEGLLARNE